MTNILVFFAMPAALAYILISAGISINTWRYWAALALVVGMILGTRFIERERLLHPAVRRPVVEIQLLEV